VPDPQDENKVIVVFQVQEYDLVKQVKLVGVREEDEEDIQKELRLKTDDPVDPAQLKADEFYLTDFYKKKGYYFSSVKLEQSLDGTITWNIFEGPLVLIDTIAFTGNPGLDTDDLPTETKSEETGALAGWIFPAKFLAFLAYPPSLFVGSFTSHPLVEKTLESDLILLRQGYYLEGFLDCRVFLEDLSFSADKTRALITIHVDTGPRYHVRNVTFQGATLFTAEDLQKAAVSRPGKRYSDLDIEAGRKRIKGLYGEKGHINAVITPLPNRPSKEPLVDVIFQIEEKEKVRAGRVIVEGNTTTKEETILLRLKELEPGGELNTKKLERSTNRLRSGGLFNAQPPFYGVEVDTPVAVDDPGARDIVLRVEEGNTANIQLAGGYSSAYGLVGVIDFTERNFDISDWGNFRGGGQTLNLRLMPGSRRQSYSISFREPYFMGEDLGFGTRIFDTAVQRRTYDEERFGGSISFDKRWDQVFQEEDEFIAGISYRLQDVDINDVKSTAPARVQRLAGGNTVVSIEPFLAYDTRDFALWPTEGYRLELKYEMFHEGLGSDFEFGKALFEAQHHTPLGENEDGVRSIFSNRLRFGHINEIESPVPFFEMYYLGGRSGIRGFKNFGVGPQENGEALGGKAFMDLTTEALHPLYNQVIYFALFHDVGTLEPELDDISDSQFRETIGFGFRLRVPGMQQAPISLDFGWVQNKQPDDERRFILFEFGSLYF
jgi:outer membrane protein insertion porin family